MALFGRSSDGAHAASSSRGNGQRRAPQSNEPAQQRQQSRAAGGQRPANSQRQVGRPSGGQQHPRRAAGAQQHADRTGNISRSREVSQRIPVVRPANQVADVIPASDLGVATEATGSYADLAAQDNGNAKLGPVVISLRNVTKIYPAQPDKPALAGITLDIRAGEFLFLVGHSGSGKSTFIRMLNREIVPTSGEIYVAGENLRTMRKWRIPYLRRNVGCVFQDFKLLPNKTAFENVAFALEVIGKSRHVIKTQVPEVLRLVGLEEKMDKLPDQLSGGEQQRVSIARSIVNRPPLLICDEPTGNLDPQTSLGIMRLLERINRTGTTVLVATHDREMVDQMRRRVLALENGVLVRDQRRGVYGYDV